jgi:hypothetical protein
MRLRYRNSNAAAAIARKSGREQLSDDAEGKRKKGQGYNILLKRGAMSDEQG